MKKRTCAFVLASFIGVASNVNAQGIPVMDASSIAQAILQVQELQRQFEQARDHLDSVTGSRNLGDLLRNPDLRGYLPDDMKDVYDDLAGSGLDGTAQEIFDRQAVDEPFGDARDRLYERPGRQAATDKAVGQRAFEGTSERFNQVEQLTSEISNTEDMKEIAELQARLQGEMAAIQVEMNRVQLMTMLSAAEQRLAEEERRNYSMEILNPENTGMPSIN